jgi:hypothetical protein
MWITISRRQVLPAKAAAAAQLGYPQLHAILWLVALRSSSAEFVAIVAFGSHR